MINLGWFRSSPSYKIVLHLFFRLTLRKQKFQTFFFFIWEFRASLVVHWWRIHLPVLETWVQSLVQENPTCHGPAKPMNHNNWDCAVKPRTSTTEPMCCNHWSPLHSGAWRLQQKKLLQQETLPTGTNSSPHSLQLQKSTRSNKDLIQPK